MQSILHQMAANLGSAYVEEAFMSVLVRIAVLASVGIALSGCAVAEVGGDVIGAGVTVAGAAVDVTTTVVSTAASTITGGSSKDGSDDKKKPD
jgi:hypothetical protein